jgi:acylpyruvate hydrolase
MRFTVLRTPLGARPHLEVAGRAVDLAQASGRQHLGTLAAALERWDETLEVAHRLVGTARSSGPAAGDDASPAPPLAPTSRIFCVGRNYAEHIAELGRETPTWPEVFVRFAGAAIGACDPIVAPALSSKVDYEGELAVLIGRRGRHVAAAGALELVAGYTVLNDVSIRDWQRRGSQWTPGKNFDGTLPVGPAIVTPDEVDATDLAIETRLNGRVVQSARTSHMLLTIPHLIEFLSSFTELLPGDLIATGTPGGVGLARGVFLRPGDTVEVEVEGVGALRNPVVADELEPVTERWRELAAQADL